MTPMIGTFSNFFKGGVSASKNQDPSMVSLLGAGIIGGYDNSRYPKDLQKTFDKKNARRRINCIWKEAWPNR